MKINMGGDVVASQFLEGRGLNMERKVIYQQATGWITIHVSAYHAWQGRISNIPDVLLKYVIN